MRATVASTLRRGTVAMLIATLAGCASVPPAPTGPVGAVALDRGVAAQMVSAYRREHGLPPVDLDPALNAVAQRQAEAMAASNVLSHEVAGTLPVRLAQAGADRRAAIENVSAGYPSFAAALAGWKRSPHHNENLLFPPVRHMGVAAAAAPGTRYKTFWSLVMTD